MRSRSSVISRLLLTLWALVLVSVESGCVHRRMTIESNPAGALVLVDGKEKGYTPVRLDFTYYGTREVTLIKDGYETQTFPAKLQTPWYQIPPLDFFADNFSPTQITNRHRFRYELHRKDEFAPGQLNQDTEEELRNRGNSIRSEALLSP